MSSKIPGTEHQVVTRFDSDEKMVICITHDANRSVLCGYRETGKLSVEVDYDPAWLVDIMVE